VWVLVVVSLWMLLQLSADGQNELVKSYLKQREQLMNQQMDQKKSYEGADHGLYTLTLGSRLAITVHDFSKFLFAIRYLYSCDMCLIVLIQCLFFRTTNLAPWVNHVF